MARLPFAGVPAAVIDPAEYVDALCRFYVGGELDESVVLPTLPELISRPARTFGQRAAAHVAAFA